MAKKSCANLRFWVPHILWETPFLLLGSGNIVQSVSIAPRFIFVSGNCGSSGVVSDVVLDGLVRDRRVADASRRHPRRRDSSFGGR